MRPKRSGTARKVTSVQLSSYYAGFSEILALRERVKAKEGDRFKPQGLPRALPGYMQRAGGHGQPLDGCRRPSAPEAQTRRLTSGAR